MKRLVTAVLLLALVAQWACSSATPAGRPRLDVGTAEQLRIGPPAVVGIDGPLGVVAQNTPAPPWVGAPPVQWTTADLMAVASREPRTMADADGDGRPDAEDEERIRKIRPDRRLLPDNPSSPAAAQWPPSPAFARDGAPTFSHTPSTPNTDVASYGADTFNYPPDSQGDVGPTQYLVGINGRIRTISKATGLADGVIDASTNAFFNPVRNSAGTSDPRVRYDRRTDRWFIVMINVAVPNRNMVAVSNTGTITLSTVWSLYQWTNTRTQGGVGGAAACLGDYPTLGVDEDALYIGVNQFCGTTLNALTFDSTSAYVINKASLVSGSLAVSQFDGVLPSGSSSGPYTPQGVDNFDTGTNAGYFIGVDNASFGLLVVRRVSNPAGSPSLSGDIAITVPTTRFPINVPHVGGALPLDGLDDRLLQAVIRNGRLWTTHQIQVNQSGVASSSGGRDGVRWYELQNLDSTPSLVQSGTVFDAASTNPRSYWMGAVMPNGQGHAVLGMSTAGATVRVNTAVTGRVATDTLGVMGTPTLYSNSQFDYNRQSSPETSQRWGDYSYTSVDPDDDMTMWTLQEYVSGTDAYSVRLLRLLAPPPASIVSLSPNTIAQTASNVAITVTGSSSSGSGFFDPGAGFADRLAASLSGSGISVTGVTYTSPTAITLTVTTSSAALGARTLTVTNPDGQTSQLVSALTVTSGTNTAPTASADSATTPFGVTLSRTAGTGVLSNDSDPENDTLTAQLVTDVTSGTLTLNANGSYTYVPANGFAGADSFTYRAFDGALQSNVATVSITVSANQSPTITAPATQNLFDPGNGVSVGPLAFTVGDPEGASIAVTRASSSTAVVPLAGVVLGGSGGSRTVTVSTAGATTGGSSTITLTASDGFASANALFTVNVTRSTAPVAASESYSTAFDTQLVVAAPGVLQNDTDVDPQTLTAVLSSTTTHGTLTLAANGGFTYLPAVGYIGPDSFSYRASDGVLTSDLVTVSLTVTSNHAPNVTPPGNVSVVDFGSGAAAGPLAFTVSDFEGTPLLVTATSSNQAIVADGGLVIGGSGGSRTVTVAAVPGTVGGTATISLFASDGQAVTAGTFTVTVTPQRGRPQAVASVVTRNVVAFTWQAPPFSVEPVVGYVLDAGFSPGTTVVTLPVGNTGAFTVSAPDGVYNVRLRAQTTGGFSAPSNELVVGTGQAVPPLAPLRLLASVQGNVVQLQWSENPLGPVITGYQLQAGHSAGVTDVAVVPFSGTARSFVGSVPTDTYFVRMVATNASGAGPPSNEAVLAVAPGACTIPAAPLGVAVSVGPGAIAVAWSPAATGAIPTSYRVLAGTGPGLSNRGVFVLPGSSTSIGGAVPAGPYFIRIQAVNACGSSPASSEVSAMVP